MNRAFIRNGIFCLFWLSLLTTLSACTGAGNVGPTPTPEGRVPVGIPLRDLYWNLGGEAELGPAISPVLERPGGSVCQFTTNVMLCYKAGATTDAERLYLAPLGKEPAFKWIATTNPAPTVYEGFREVYNKKFFGERFAGRPLTGLRENIKERRIEQIFENMGLYTRLDDPEKKVYLLPFGIYTCQEECGNRRPGPSFEWGIDLLASKMIDRLGGYALFGPPISPPYKTKDGITRQILDKIAIYTLPDSPEVPHLSPVAVELKKPRMAPGPQRYGQKENMVFRVVHDDVGYHIPIPFDDFIATHGGTEISGAPLSDPYEVISNGQRVARQCFENYCLDYSLDGSDAQRVSLVSLGEEYLKTQQPFEEGGIFTISRDTVTLFVSEKKSQLTNQETQVIQLALVTRVSRIPIPDIEAFVTLALPNGVKDTHDMPPTKRDGLTQATLEPLKDVANGTIIPYVVCLKIENLEPICSHDSFLIWNNR